MVALTSKRRNALPKSEFAIPSKAPASGSYPIDTKARAQNALARVAQHGTPAEKKQVKAAVARKFPSVGKSKK